MSPLMLNSSSIHELIKGCLDNNRSSQRQLFEIYAPKMIIVCKRYARYDLEAEDIMQESFIKVFKNLDKFQFEGSFEGWIRKIMVNTALKYISRKHITHEKIMVEFMPEEPVDPTVFSKLNADEILNLVTQLPDGYRLVFNLYAIEGYSHKEIGVMLNIEESTSRSQLVKARRMLQEKIIELQKIAI